MTTVTHIGGPTTLIEVDGWRLLTDPTFDPPGERYAFGWGISSVKLAGPALSPADLGPLDAVLLTHDHHGDNLDAAGRALLPTVPRLVTTVAGARRLRTGTGLAPWSETTLESPDKPPLRVTATPCRHGPPLSRPIVGEVTGFALHTTTGILWISGDTVPFAGTQEVIDRLEVDIAVLHLGSVRFPLTGPLRYTMTGTEAVALCGALKPRVAIPVHYEGWAHFHEGRAGVESTLFTAPADIQNRFRWLTPGEPTRV
ncbi:MBL fold metallo-hydrolase [Actinokineospora diospyrosa]|uniref:L-ascorbate metabolism protein UlaG, beta-lactamase superfamily n=1 Tax=Actinokineospora diospyrosa TaxID=103728 RepID=A0ABT1I8X0_9PSEU|nr:MBL fold metallo-hydrolase [Actinokineospora diospyrosa]MCP2269085.1 L-ascorbate metabolism protein UlaG, beta-lactamase superfamily [Actinokineospora diospyrosa]